MVAKVKIAKNTLILKFQMTSSAAILILAIDSKVQSFNMLAWKFHEIWLRLTLYSQIIAAPNLIISRNSIIFDVDSAV